MKRIAILMVGAVFALSGPTAAMATGSGSTCQAYNPQTCQTVNGTNTTQSSGGTLPFTGLNVTTLLAGAVVLLGTGLVLRRVSRRMH